MMEQAKFTYYPLGKTLEKQTKTIEEQGEKHVKALKVFKSDAQQSTIKDEIPKIKLNEKAQNELNEIEKIEKKVNRENLI